MAARRRFDDRSPRRSSGFGRCCATSTARAWHPAVDQPIEGEPATGRRGADFSCATAARMREQLLALSDREHSFRYFLVEAPVALRDYVAEVRLRPVTERRRDLLRMARASSTRRRASASGSTRFVARGDHRRRLRRARRRRCDDAPPPRRSRRAVAPGGDGSRGGADALRRARRRWNCAASPLPPPGPGEARLRQTAIGVNFIDVYCRRGSFTLVPPGGVLGMEAAGVVESVGAGVANVCGRATASPTPARRRAPTPRCATCPPTCW